MIYTCHSMCYNSGRGALVDLTDLARGKQAEVEARIKNLRDTMHQMDEPDDPIGGQCFYPYACGFFGYCGRNLPKPNIFDVGGIQLRTKLANYEKGIVSFEDIRAKKCAEARQDAPNPARA